MKARPIADLHAFDPGYIRGGGELPDPDPVAERQHREIMRALGGGRVVIERLVYDDLDPRDWGPGPVMSGIQLTKQALDALAQELCLTSGASRY